MNLKREAMQRIKESTDESGGAKFPSYMLKNMRQWEREGLIELHLMNTLTVARITDKGRQYAISVKD